MTAVFENAPLKRFLLPDDGRIPNNPTLPLLLYQGALRFTTGSPAAVCEEIIYANGWGGSWRNGIYSFHHYHSTAHEVLAIARGQARVHFGGESGPRINVQAGDVVVIPAGVGHKNLGSSRDLLVVGAYPPGQTWDLLRGDAGERPLALQNIARVPRRPAILSTEITARCSYTGPPDAAADHPCSGSTLFTRPTSPVSS